MNKKMSKRQRDLKSKLMAAICMLLVSSIMMVSTTYAWFTLSTAPEVTGITTAVGANGNLEMALMPSDALDAHSQGDDYGITSGEGDSTKLPLYRNVTWGNLVDVSDTTTYGLNSINLYPAKLHVETLQDGDKTIAKVAANPLQTPQYGADGRVSTLEAKTITGAFDIAKGQFLENANGVDGALGVRAIGESSSMTARQLAYRTAVANGSTYSGQALNTAKTSLGNRGSALASIAMKHATADGNETYAQTDIDQLKGAVADLEGAVAQMETALRNLIIADSIAPSSVTDDTFKAIVDGITKAEDWDEVRAVSGAVITSSMETMITKFEATEANVATAKTKVNALSAGCGWSEISEALGTLLSTTAMKVNGLSMAEITGSEDGKSNLVNKIIDDGFKVNLLMESGSGAYADLADFGGAYASTIKVNVTYGGLLNNKPVDATMSVQNTAEGTPYITNYKVAGFSGDGGNSSSTPITEFYGYILDLAFRTNAAGSKLLLQQTAIDRVYSDSNTNENTMGHGANMTFESTSSSFDGDQVKELMGFIRIVFFDPETSEIINYAKLDTANAVRDNTKVTASIVLTDADGAVQDSLAIMDLEQNTAHALSVMVYLDGEHMQNEHVAADQASSMTGNMNLQFASSANLKPMEYSDLRGENGGADASYITIPGVAAPTGWKATSAYAMGGKLVVGLSKTDASVADPTTVVINVDGTDYTAKNESYMGMNGWVIDVTNATAGSKISVTIDGVAPTQPSEDEEEGEDVTETVNVSINGTTSTTAKGAEYTFTATSEPTVTVGDVEIEVTGTDGSYTIPAEQVTGDIVITYTV